MQPGQPGTRGVYFSACVGPRTVYYGLTPEDNPMHRFKPTAADADRARFVLSLMDIKARVRRFDASLRVCLEGVVTDETRKLAAEALADADLRDPCGGAVSFGGYQAFAYVVR